MKLLLNLMLALAPVAMAAESGRATFEEVRAMAYRGDYQAQRNLAYGYSSASYAGQDKNPILACAWRIVLIKSGNEKVDETDVGNHKVYCDRLDQVSRQAAEAQAVSLRKKIGAR